MAQLVERGFEEPGVRWFESPLFHNLNICIMAHMNYFGWMQTEQPVSGTLRITNPKTLEKWKQTGKYQELIDQGYTYAPGCGRFRIGICTCSDCRRRRKK